MTSATRRAAVAACALLTTTVLSAQPGQTQVDEYTRHELPPPGTSSVKVTYEVSATTEGARTYTDRLPAGTTASGVAVTDMMTGAPLTFTATASAITVTLARPVPPKGQGRIRIEKTIKNPLVYTQAGGAATFTLPLGAGRHDILLPAGYELIGSNIPARVLTEEDGRTKLDVMNVLPGNATLVVSLRAGAL